MPLFGLRSERLLVGGRLPESAAESVRPTKGSVPRSVQSHIDARSSGQIFEKQIQRSASDDHHTDVQISVLPHDQQSVAGGEARSRQRPAGALSYALENGVRSFRSQVPAVLRCTDQRQSKRNSISIQRFFQRN